jgi:hypothetical protein
LAVGGRRSAVGGRRAVFDIFALRALPMRHAPGIEGGRWPEPDGRECEKLRPDARVDVPVRHLDGAPSSHYLD